MKQNNIKIRILMGIAIELILLLVLFNLLTNSLNSDIKLIYPKDNSIINEKYPNFRWKGNAHTLYVDDNIEFVSPIIEHVEGHSHKLETRLNFTTYYWKLLGRSESPVSAFKVE